MGAFGGSVLGEKCVGSTMCLERAGSPLAAPLCHAPRQPARPIPPHCHPTHPQEGDVLLFRFNV